MTFAPNMVTENRQKRARLTCKCGTSYILQTIHDFPSTCTNERCRADLDMSDEGLWKYQESILALMGALGLRRAYVRELDFAERMSQKFASPYTISVIEVLVKKSV